MYVCVCTDLNPLPSKTHVIVSQTAANSTYKGGQLSTGPPPPGKSLCHLKMFASVNISIQSFQVILLILVSTRKYHIVLCLQILILHNSSCFIFLLLYKVQLRFYVDII